MIDLTDVRRVRLYRGTRVHRTRKTRWGLATDCGKPVKLTGPAGRRYDEPLPPETLSNCPTCNRNPKES